MRIVITDASVIINLVIADGLRLLRDIPEHEFVVPENVVVEVMNEAQLRKLEVALAEGWISVVRLDAVDDMQLFVDLRRIMGSGEAACLALANGNGWTIACDEKRAFKREASRLLGAERIITTVDIFLLSIRAGLLTVEEADAAKAVLAENRFSVPFESFAELLAE